MVAGGGGSRSPSQSAHTGAWREPNRVQWKPRQPKAFGATASDDLPLWGRGHPPPLGSREHRETRGPTPPKNKDCMRDRRSKYFISDYRASYPFKQ